MTSTAQTRGGFAVPGAALPWGRPGTAGPRNTNSPVKGELRMS
jgi:hypothetical protein